MELAESPVPGSKLVRLARASLGQTRRTRRCPDTPRLDGKRALVTGATNGIGVEIARGLLARGAELILPCRNPAKGERLRDELRRAAGDAARIELVTMDLEDLDSVRAAAHEIAGGAAPIDLLVENAGVAEQRYGLSRQGHEITFAINVLGHFVLRRALLAAGLLPHARVVVVTGDIYVLESDCTPSHSWSGRSGGMRAYCRSKLGNLWIGFELQKRHPELEVYVVHPGAIDTGLGGKLGAVGDWFKRATMLTPELGAQMVLICATQDGLRRGAYYHNVFGLMHLPAGDAALNAARAAELWATCERLAGDRAGGGAAHPLAG